MVPVKTCRAPINAEVLPWLELVEKVLECGVEIAEMSGLFWLLTAAYCCEHSRLHPSCRIATPSASKAV